MSATFVHSVASIPFTRYGLGLSALIIGSIMPDLPYFLPFSQHEQFGHTLVGLFLFCIPAGMAALWIFHYLLKYPLFSLFPYSHQQRMSPFIHNFPSWSGKTLGVNVISLFVGAWTHIVWDSCTHWYGWTVQRVPLLQLTIFKTSQGTLKLYKVLQHGGTVVGTLLLIYWYLKWLKNASVAQVPPIFHLSNSTKLFIVLSIVFLACLAGSVYGYYKTPVIDDIESFSYFVVVTMRASISSIILEIFVFSTGWHILRLKEEYEIVGR
jgi:hypothetical protein